jgi:hypothetical protein
MRRLLAMLVVLIGALPAASGATEIPDLGPNVYVFTPDTPQQRIQAAVDALAAQQVSNQFGAQRYALLFEPGVYGSSASPLNFQVGYYTSVAGLGRSPRDVIINGSINVYNQCDAGGCFALNNFWRSLSNLTINVDNASLGCHAGEFWAVSQASPLRRVLVNGFTALSDFCSAPAYASGGFIADSIFAGRAVDNGTQQQWLIRNSAIDGWSNGLWNQVFSGVVGAPEQCFPAHAPCGGPYTTLAASPATREPPYLFTDSDGHLNVFVPAARRETRGASWSDGATPGYALPIERFFIARPTDTAASINAALGAGMGLILTPGIYRLDGPIEATHPDTIVLALGFPTLVPQSGDAAMKVASAPGTLISGVIFDAGPINSAVLLQIGENKRGGDAADPSGVYDVFFRIGGATPGRAAASLVVNSDNVILDDIWAWRADHGEGLGWARNTGDIGIIVNGDNVTAYGLFVEHYQKHEVLWNGDNGAAIFFQNEMPYDAPNQAEWMEAPGVGGYAAFKVADNVRSFRGYGMGSYNNFVESVNVYAARAFEVPATLAPGSLNDLLTICLSGTASGGVLNVVNDKGGVSSIFNPDVATTVAHYP